jgi:hypothetical protein
MRFFFPYLLLLIPGAVLADSPAEPTPQITTSRSKTFFFTMAPPKYKDVGETYWKLIREPFGAAFELREDGTFRELWTVKGWYAFEVFLSDDGRYLVRMGDWPTGERPSKDHLAVAFYDRGKLLAQYSTADLVKDPTKVLRSVSHYVWLHGGVTSQGEPPHYSDANNTFHLKTIDGIEYTFDATTGKITRQKAAP